MEGQRLSGEFPLTTSLWTIAPPNARCQENFVMDEVVITFYAILAIAGSWTWVNGGY